MNEENVDDLSKCINNTKELYDSLNIQTQDTTSET